MLHIKLYVCMYISKMNRMFKITEQYCVICNWTILHYFDIN